MLFDTGKGGSRSLFIKLAHSPLQRICPCLRPASNRAGRLILCGPSSIPDSHAGAIPKSARIVIFEAVCQMSPTRHLARATPGVTLNWTNLLSNRARTRNFFEAAVVGADVRLVVPSAEATLSSRPCRIHPSAASDHDGARGGGRRGGVRGDSYAFIRTGTACLKQARHANIAERA